MTRPAPWVGVLVACLGCCWTATALAAPPRIVNVHPMDPAPGTAVRLEFSKPLREDPEVTLEGRALPILQRSAQSVVVGIPADLPDGLVELHLGRGERSYDLMLRIKGIQRRKVVRDLLGGLALFLLGLRSLAQGLRSSVGQRDRSLLSGVTSSPVRALGFGVALGGLTQSTASSAAVLIGLGQARMVDSKAGVWVLTGAYLGTVLTAALVPFAATREALLVVALGTLLLLLAPGRRARGFSVVVVAFGLLALGLRTMQAGFQPLLGDPELMRVIGSLGEGGLLQRGASAGLGALLAGLLQGPGPVFALVLGLAQSSGAIDLESGLSMLSGAALGSALGVFVLALPYGESTRALRRGFLLFGVVALALQLLSLPLWPAVADRLVAGSPEAIAHGKKALLPHMGVHLSVGFVCSQLFAAVGFVLAQRLLAGSGRASTRAPEAERRAGVFLSAGAALADALQQTGAAVEATVGAALEHDPARRAHAEKSLAAAEAALTEAGAALKHPSSTPAADRQHALRPSWLALRHLRHASAVLLRDVEQAMADNSRLPDHVVASTQGMLELLQERFATLADLLRRAEAPDLRAAQAAEIRLNAIEADVRQRLLVHGNGELVTLGGSGMDQLPVGLEQIGNHVYRLTSTLVHDPEHELL